MLRLKRSWRNMFRLFGPLFLSGRASRDSTRASVVAHVVHRDVIDDYSLAVYVLHVRDIVHGSVIEEGAVVPISALIAHANVTEAVVYATVESNFRAPVTFMKNEGTV